MITAQATFRNSSTDGIRSDGYPIYVGLTDGDVYLLPDQDYDFVLDIRRSTRRLTLDFRAQNNGLTGLPFSPVESVPALIRVDEVYSVAPGHEYPTRLLMWFDVGRDGYQLRFDGVLGTDLVLVTRTPENPAMWTIQSTGAQTARLESGNPARRKVIGYFMMPFKITVEAREDLPKTCP
jgi:hypothetical protein